MLFRSLIMPRPGRPGRAVLPSLSLPQPPATWSRRVLPDSDSEAVSRRVGGKGPAVTRNLGAVVAVATYVHTSAVGMGLTSLGHLWIETSQPLRQRRPRRYDSDCILCSAPPAAGPQRQGTASHKNWRSPGDYELAGPQRTCWARHCSVRWQRAIGQTTSELLGCNV